MKPAFALDFRDDTITMSHRSGNGWQVVGAVPIDTPDLTEAIRYLRTTALGLSPRGLATKLILPEDQILYIPVEAPGPDDESRRAQVIAALEGRTPYDVADLAFDYCGSGPDVKVAVIAKQTLAEAEAFAVGHRLNPVSFVAAPDTSGTLALTQAALITLRVTKLSVQSSTNAYCGTKVAKSSAFKRWHSASIVMSALSWRKLKAACCALLWPISASRYSICRCKLLRSMVSSSTSVICPTPLATK